MTQIKHMIDIKKISYNDLSILTDNFASLGYKDDDTHYSLYINKNYIETNKMLLKSNRNHFCRIEVYDIKMLQDIKVRDLLLEHLI